MKLLTNCGSWMAARKRPRHPGHVAKGHIAELALHSAATVAKLRVYDSSGATIFDDNAGKIAASVATITFAKPGGW